MSYDSPRRFDLEERTFRFATDVKAFVRKFPSPFPSGNEAQQLIRAASSVGANYIEANEAMGRRDFAMRIRISLKEVKESAFWLRLIDEKMDDLQKAERARLIQEAKELLFIFSAILKKVKNKPKI